ncbi:MAG: 2Fe-2S iron-sulfur cluster-binding protein [Pirellulaceae bacterium]
MTERLPPQPGEWIDRSRPLKFKFEGREYTGFAGDTISSALAANGLRLLGRSFKYHRPRGIYSLANHDVNVLVEDARHTNIRGDVTPLWDGADLRAVNTFGGLAGDRLKIVDWFSKFLPVGFYYKAFHSPKSLFPFYERRMRNIAGLGAVNAKWERGHFPAVYDFCDVLVVGAGPAGMSAAIAAAELGLRVVLVDEHFYAGGNANYELWATGDITDLPRQWHQRIAALPISLRTSTVAAGYYADHWIALVDGKRLTRMRARSVVLATGAIEQPAVFANNDLPGIMLSSAAQRLVRQYAVKPFQKGVVVTANSEGYSAAMLLFKAGCKLDIVDLRLEKESGYGGEQAELIRSMGIQVHFGHAVTLANPSSGKRGIHGVQVTPLDSTGKPKQSGSFEIPCDGLAMSVGFAPADGLFNQAGGRMTWSEDLQQFIPKSAPAGLFAAGRVNGVYGFEQEATDGRRAGLAAAAYLGKTVSEILADPQRPKSSPTHPYPIFPHPTTKCFVDLDEDVHYKDFVNAAQEGFDQVELMKRYSTFGMGTSQGKLSNINAIRILAHIKGQTVPQTGVTTSRPFIHPVSLGHLAGRGFHPHRRTPLEGRHEELGAVFMHAGDWRRPAYYTRPNVSPQEAIAEEVTAVRTAAGMIDVGTLGKLEISGPDAGEFIERIYTGRFAKMKPGTARYGLMCDESGVIIDDGLVARLAADRFYVTTTTSASGAVYREMQRWAIIWGMQVVLASATGSRGGINLAGPKAREILKELCDFDVSAAAFPYMAVREGNIAGVSARFLRVGFVGEWGCEIHVPAYSAKHVWSAIEQAGHKQGIRPFGVEAQRILRLEKAHIIVSQDTDGLTNPYEANMAWAVKDDKPFFIGQRSLQIIRPRPLKRVLAGFTLPKETEAAKVPKECHLIIENKEIVGRITSITRSPTLNQVIGLAFVAPERAQPGTHFQIRLDDGSLVTGTVVGTPFYDPLGQRQEK